IAITQGDCAGIGPETIAKAFRDAPEALRGCFAVGELQTMRRAADAVLRGGESSLPIAMIDSPEQAWSVPGRCLPLLALPGLPGPAPWGRISREAGEAAARCV